MHGASIGGGGICNLRGKRDAATRKPDNGLDMSWYNLVATCVGLIDACGLQSSRGMAAGLCRRWMAKSGGVQCSVFTIVEVITSRHQWERGPAAAVVCSSLSVCRSSCSLCNNSSC